VLECALPKCGAREKFLRSGTLHLVDTLRPDGTFATKIVWLCAGCSLQYTVQTWRAPGEQIRPRDRRPMLSMDDILSALVPHRIPLQARV
jgi:hypothetical protein